MLIALEAALAELATDSSAANLADRLGELRSQRDAVTDAAHTALAGPPSERELEVVSFTLGRIEAALRARAVVNA